MGCQTVWQEEMEHIMESMDIANVIIGIVAAIGLLWLTSVARQKINNKWRLLYLVPAAVILLCTVMSGTEPLMAGVYIAGALLMTGFFTESVSLRRASCILAILSCLVTVPACVGAKTYRSPHYLAEFEECFATMKAHYVLTEQKGIDWDELYAVYRPRFEDIDRRADAVDNYICWQEFTAEFYDGHTCYMAEEEVVDAAACKAFGNDYGLSLMQLTSGEFVAVNVQPDSAIARAGIHNGTVITAWDGKSPDSYYNQIPYTMFAFPDDTNKAFYQPIYMSGIGGETVELTYIDDKGETNSVTAHSLGCYATRLKQTIQMLDQNMQLSNLEYQLLGDDTAVMCISSMQYDSDSYSGSDYSRMETELKAKLAEMKAAGVKKLILDLRNNTGGSPYMIASIGSLFAPKGEHIQCYDSVLNRRKAEYEKDADTGKYLVGNCLTYTGQDLVPEMQIVLLVNAETISAGDHMTMMFSEYPNVTIMGFTKTNGSGQAVTGIELEDGALSFSAIPTLQEDGSVYIDSGIDHISPVPIDVIVSFDEEAVAAIFDEGRDYLLEKAAEL